MTPDDKLDTLATQFDLSDEARVALAELMTQCSADRPSTDLPTLLPSWSDEEATTLPRSEHLSLSFSLDDSADVETVRVPEPKALDERYTDQGVIGIGGMGEVRRMFDARLGRAVAMKFLRPELAGRPRVVARFLGEAQIGAQLQHPGLVPIHDVGSLPDGRVWFTMKEVAGHSLDKVISEVHVVSRDRWRAGATGWTFHRLVEAFATVCEAVGYAHSRGVIHRDLKPENIMVGGYGEVLVLDWGIAKVLGQAHVPDDETTVWTSRSDTDSLRTRMGAVAGTVLYMAPEQIRGEVDQLDARTDVYALGTLLYEILAGTPPFRGKSHNAILAAVLDGDRQSIHDRLADAGRGVTVPAELVGLCDEAMAYAAKDRPSDALALASQVRAWLEGAAREDRALELAGQADALAPEARALRERASELREQAKTFLEAVPTWAGEEAKAEGWADLDRAHQLEETADLLAVDAELILGTALTLCPDLPALHERLITLHRRDHALGEAAGEAPRTARAAARLTQHALALPDDHPARQQTMQYLRGTGSLSLQTDPPGAEVTLERFILRRRRWVAEPVRVLGTTPLVEVPLEMGSWCCVVRADGRAPVRYPVHIERGGHWDGRRPGDTTATPLRLPKAETVAPDDCIVPAGWFVVGGDPGATGSLRRQRLWCDGFVMQRHPVRFDAFLRFLQDLWDTGRTNDALRWMPRRRGSADQLGEPLVDQIDGQFVLPPHWSGDLPAIMIPFASAMGYAAWWSARTGQNWRLPGELEWEKAARGVDGRLFPWGDHFDASWAALEDSHSAGACVVPVTAFPTDESVYGVRGLAGNVRDWCLDAWHPEGPPTPDDIVQTPQVGDADGWRVRRGGSWGDMPGRARVADRDWYHSDYRYDYLGFRLVRPL